MLCPKNRSLNNLVCFEKVARCSVLSGWRDGNGKSDVLSSFDRHFGARIVLDHFHYRAERLAALAQNELAILHANPHVHTPASAHQRQAVIVRVAALALPNQKAAQRLVVEHGLGVLARDASVEPRLPGQLARSTRRRHLRSDWQPRLHTHRHHSTRQRVRLRENKRRHRHSLHLYVARDRLKRKVVATARSVLSHYPRRVVKRRAARRTPNRIEQIRMQKLLVV